MRRAGVGEGVLRGGGQDYSFDGIRWGGLWINRLWEYIAGGDTSVRRAEKRSLFPWVGALTVYDCAGLGSTSYGGIKARLYE